jgi:hypothetical protein
MRNSFNIFLLTSHITVHFFVSVKVKQCDIVTLSVNVCSIFIPAFVHTRSERRFINLIHFSFIPFFQNCVSVMLLQQVFLKVTSTSIFLHLANGTLRHLILFPSVFSFFFSICIKNKRKKMRPLCFFISTITTF